MNGSRIERRDELGEIFGVGRATARELGLPISTDIVDGVLELMKLYPQPTRAQSGGGGVEYLPVPRQKEAMKLEA